MQGGAKGVRNHFRLVRVRRLSYPVYSNKILNIRGEQQCWNRFGSRAARSPVLSSSSSTVSCHCVRRDLHMTTPTMHPNSLSKIWCSRVSGFVLCSLLALSCSGCFALFVGAAGGAAGAVYVMGKLNDEVNYYEVRVVHNATVAALG